MFALRTEADKEFEAFAKLAEGNYQLVYMAYDQVDPPTKTGIENFIKTELIKLTDTQTSPDTPEKKEDEFPQE